MSRILSIEKLDRYGRASEHAGSPLTGSSGASREDTGAQGGRRRTGSVRVTLEDGGSFTFPERRALRLGLSEGEELRQETYEEIIKDLRSSCMQRCGTLLGSRDYPEKRLRSKLEDAGYPPLVIEECIGKLKAARYLDDRRYARNYVRSHLCDRSRRRIMQDLVTRGIAEEYVEEALASAAEETDPDQAQMAQIRRLLQKRGYDPAAADYKEKQKTMAFLHRKGYEADLIRRALEDRQAPEQ